MTHTCVIGEADPFLARLLLRYAEAYGLQAVCAQTGEGVLAMVRRQRPSVVILDNELPGTMRGWAVIEAIRADSDLRHTPLIHCSWHNEADAGLSTGVAVAHLHKPALRYDDFVAAMVRAGVSVAQRRAPQPGLALEEGMDATEHQEMRDVDQPYP